MFRAVQVFVALVAAHTLSQSALLAQDCLCAPSCTAPSCVAPSCAVPSDCCYMGPSCAAPGTCGGSCGTCQSGGSGHSGGGCQKCCPPGKKHWIHIDLSRTINKGNKTKKTGGFMGEAPPAGASVVMSSPVMFSTAAAIPINFQPASSASAADIQTLVAAAVQAQKASAAAASAAAASDTTKCADPCGDIKQLQSDVQQLKQIVVNLTNVVEALDKKIVP